MPKHSSATEPDAIPFLFEIPKNLWRALENCHQTTGQPVEQILRAALADYLQVGQSALYQVSTAGALVEGLYQGVITVATLKQHGDLGLGTFDGLDGEMVVVDGRFFQVRSDGRVIEVDDQVRTPYAVITKFDPAPSTRIGDCQSITQLYQQLDKLRTSDNIFYALRVDGEFDLVHTRAVAKTTDGIPLVEAAAQQPEFRLHSVIGTVVGFWSPKYVKTLTVPGYHLHFLTQDRSAGGHLLDCSGRNLIAQLEGESNLRLSLPKTASFLTADLSSDPTAELQRAETSSLSRAGQDP